MLTRRRALQLAGQAPRAPRVDSPDYRSSHRGAPLPSARSAARFRRRKRPRSWIPRRRSSAPRSRMSRRRTTRRSRRWRGQGGRVGPGRRRRAVHLPGPRPGPPREDGFLGHRRVETRQVVGDRLWSFHEHRRDGDRVQHERLPEGKSADLPGKTSGTSRISPAPVRCTVASITTTKRR